MGRLLRSCVAGSPPRTADVLRTGTFLLLLYVFLWRIVQPHLLFHGGGIISDFPSFYTGWGFLREHLSYPGGPTVYASALLSQTFYHSWLGALVITLQALAMYLCITYLAGKTLIGYVPAMLLAFLYGSYAYHFPTTMAALLALVFTCVYVVSVGRLRARRTYPPASLALSLVSYYVLAGGFLLFLSLCLMYELLAGGGWRRAVTLAAVGLALPFFVGVLVFGLSPADAYTHLLPVSWRVVQYSERSRLLAIVCLLYAVPPAAMLAGFVRRRRWPERQRTRIRWAVETLVVLGLGMTAALAGFDRERKTRLAVDYYAWHRRWPQVLAEARRLPEDRFVIHAADRALFHTGRLGDEMFRRPQDPAALLLLGTGDRWLHWQCIDVHLELGLLNVAEHSLLESLEKLGDRPMILQRLATVNLAKGNIDTARIYLGMLRRTLFHSRWAKDYLRRLESDPSLSGDQAVQHLRSIAPERDFPLFTVTKDRMLTSLLEKNRDNRMALEYLAAWQLLNGQLAGFVQHLGRFREAGYTELPRYFEEAALLYAYATRRTLDAAGYTPSDQSQQRMVHIVTILDRCQGDKQAALAEMARYHRDTYTFFHLYLRPERTP